MTGSFLGAFTFGGKTYRASDVPGEVDADAFLAAYTLAGEERWARNFARVGTGVAMDPEDGVLVTGHYASGETVGGRVLSGAPGSIDNVFVAKLDRLDGGVAALTRLPGVVSASPAAVEGTVAADGEPRVAVNLVLEADDALGGVVSALGGLGSHIRALRTSEPTLEDVFVELVGRGFEEGSPDAEPVAVSA